MTISEFRAWLEGFKEAIGDRPTAEQWQKIQDKIGTIAAPVAPAALPSYQTSPYQQPGYGQTLLGQGSLAYQRQGSGLWYADGLWHNANAINGGLQ